MNLSMIVWFALGLVIIFAAGMLLVWPLKTILKLLINALIGGIVLLIFNVIGGMFGVNIVINPLNAIIAGIFGIPGIVFILILQWIL